MTSGVFVTELRGYSPELFHLRRVSFHVQQICSAFGFSFVAGGLAFALPCIFGFAYSIGMLRVFIIRFSSRFSVGYAQGGSRLGAYRFTREGFCIRRTVNIDAYRRRPSYAIPFSD